MKLEKRLGTRFLTLVVLALIGWASFWFLKGNDYNKEIMRDSTLVSAWSYEYRSKHKSEDRFRARFRDTETGIYFEEDISGYLFTQYAETKKHIATRFSVSERDLKPNGWLNFREFLLIMLFSTCLAVGFTNCIFWLCGLDIY